MIPSQRATLYTSPRGVKTKNAISKQLITDCFSVPHSSDLIGKSCDQIVHFMECFKVFQTFMEKKAKPFLKSIPSTSTQSNRDLILYITVEKLQVHIHVLVTEIISNLARAAICNSMEELAFFKTSRFYIFPRGAQQNLLFTQNPWLHRLQLFLSRAHGNCFLKHAKLITIFHLICRIWADQGDTTIINPHLIL